MNLLHLNGFLTRKLLKTFITLPTNKNIMIVESMMKLVRQYLRVGLPEYTHLQHTSTAIMTVNLEDIRHGLMSATDS